MHNPSHASHTAGGLTIFSLVYAMVAFRKGNQKHLQYGQRARVFFQFATVAALVGYGLQAREDAAKKAAEPSSE